MVSSLKKLVSVQTIRQIYKDGQLTLNCPTDCYVVTPEARDEAKKLGIRLVEEQNGCKVDHLQTKGVKLITGSALTLAKIKDSGNSKVSLIDLVGTLDCQTIAAGLMVLENSFMPCFMDYAEIDVVLAGQLHIRCMGETIIADAGDTVFIPKGLEVEFGTLSSVRYVYISCQVPAV